MRALAVQQRTIWHPGTATENTVLLPASDPRVPAGLPARIGTVRLKQLQDSQIVGRPRFPMIKNATRINFGAYVVHDPDCPLDVHSTFRVNSIFGTPTAQYARLLTFPYTDQWTYATGSTLAPTSDLVGVFVGTAGNCRWFMAEDWITLTP